MCCTENYCISLFNKHSTDREKWFIHKNDNKYTFIYYFLFYLIFYIYQFVTFFISSTVIYAI